MNASTAAEATLGFDTATSDAAVAVTRGDEVLYEDRVAPEDGGRPRHAAALLGEIERAVGAAGGWRSISRIALGVGPGTFTGLRVGVATGRALAQARGLPVAPVISLRALAAGGDGPLCLAMIDARRGEVFAGAYGADGRAVIEPFVAAPQAAAERALEGGADVVAVGDGSVRFREVLEAAGIEVPADGDAAHRIAARHVCELGRESDTVAIERVTPIYLRRPDAEVWRER